MSKIPTALKYGLLGLVILVVVASAFWIYTSVINGYVAEVGNEKVSVAEYKFYLNSIKQSILSQLNPDGQQSVDPATIWDTKIDGETYRDVAKKRALEVAKEYKVQYIKAKEAKLTLNQEDKKLIDSNMDSLIKEYGSKVNAENYVMQNYGVTLDELREILNQASLAGKYQQQEMAAMTISDDDIKAYYDSHLDIYKKTNNTRPDGEEAAWVKHILISTMDPATGAELLPDKLEEARKKAEEVLARAKAGEDFAKLAGEYSEDGNAQQGGDYIFSRNVMVPEFEKAAFEELQPGEISGLVKTAYGYHIIKLEEKIAKDAPASFRAAKEYWEYNLNADLVKSSKYQEKVEQFKNEIKLNMNQKVYDSIVISA